MARGWLRLVPVYVVLLLVVVGVVLSMRGFWRDGGAVLAGSALLAALLRLVLPTSAVGVLAVRSRAFDVVFLTGIAILLGAMAFISVTPRLS